MAIEKGKDAALALSPHLILIFSNNERDTRCNLYLFFAYKDM